MGRNSRRRRERHLNKTPHWSEEPFITQSPLRRARTGALMGGIGGLLALAVGAIRIAFALAGGAQISFDELSGLVLYFAGFVFAGAMVGVLWPFTRTTAGRYGVGVAGAAIGFYTMCHGFFGPAPSWDGAHWFSWTGCSVFFGVMLARQLAD